MTPEERKKKREWVRRYREKNREQINARNRERYANDPEYRQRMLDAGRRSYAKHRDERVTRRRERYATDPEYRLRCQTSVDKARKRRY